MRTKNGFIDSISIGENIGFLTEDVSQTKYIFFLDDYTSTEIQEMRRGTPVYFNHDYNYEISMFVAENISINENKYKKVI